MIARLAAPVDPATLCPAVPTVTPKANANAMLSTSERQKSMRLREETPMATAYIDVASVRELSLTVRLKDSSRINGSKGRDMCNRMHKQYCSHSGPSLGNLNGFRVLLATPETYSGLSAARPSPASNAARSESVLLLPNGGCRAAQRFCHSLELPGSDVRVVLSHVDRLVPHLRRDREGVEPKVPQDRSRRVSKRVKRHQLLLRPGDPVIGASLIALNAAAPRFAEPLGSAVPRRFASDLSTMRP